MLPRKTCLVLEGGGLRGIYTNGVLLEMKRHGLQYDCVMGISAGALNAASWVADELERAAIINTRFINDNDYIGPMSLLQYKSIVNFDFLFYGKGEELEPFNFDRFEQNLQHIRYVAGATDASTGKLKVFDSEQGLDVRLAAQASASIPALTPGTQIDGELYYDGGLSDPMLLSKALEDGYEKIVVVLTQDSLTNRSSFTPALLRLMRLRMRETPAIYENLLKSGDMYQQVLTFADELEREGRIFIIRPSRIINISFREYSSESMSETLHMGVMDMKSRIDELERYLKS